MPPISTIAMGAAAMLTYCAAAKAQPTNLATDCKSNPCVYDGHNQRVGLPTENGYLIRQIGSQWYSMQYDSSGILPVSFYFGQPNCIGQRYVEVGYARTDGSLATYLPQLGSYDGQAIYVPSSTPLVVEAVSIGSGPASCANWPPGSGLSIVAQPAQPLDTTVFYPPFRVQ